MVQAIQVLRFHLLELEKVSTLLLGTVDFPTFCAWHLGINVDWQVNVCTALREPLQEEEDKHTLAVDDWFEYYFSKCLSTLF